jgi:hypothetical protein
LKDSDNESQKSATDENLANKNEAEKEEEPKEGAYNSSPNLRFLFYN